MSPLPALENIKQALALVNAIARSPLPNRVLPDAIGLLANSVGRAALGATLFQSLGERWRETLQAHVDKNGKWTKFEVVYTPVAPPPVFWEYNCGQCFAFIREGRTCRWVTEQGFPNPGEIHPQGWCAVWMPLDGEKPLSFLGKVPWFLREPAPAIP